jgi:putative membrane protein insertion efficiency factor
VAKLINIIVRGYQLFVSPLSGPSCRFYPSCSSYALECINRHGAFWGIYLTLKRLLKCHPWHKGGVDLVPEKPLSRVGKKIDMSKKKNGLEKI